MRDILSTLAALDKRIRYIVLLFILLTIIWTVLYVLGGKEYYAPGATGLAADLFRAIGSNLAFFGLFGLATLIPSFIQPRLEPIDRRLSFLITSDQVSTAAQSFIRGEITKICGYVERSEIRIRLRGLDASTGSVDLEQRLYSTFRNTFESEDYVDSDFLVVVHPDLSIDGKSGGIDIAEFITSGGREEIFDVPLTLSSDTRFEKRVPLRIRPNGTTDYRMHCWIWYNPSLMYYLYNHRFVEDASIVVQNDLETSVRIASPLRGGGVSDVPPKGSLELHRGPIEPGQCEVFRLES